MSEDMKYAGLIAAHREEIAELEALYRAQKARAARLWALLDHVEVVGDALKLKPEAGGIDAWRGNVGAEVPF